VAVIHFNENLKQDVRETDGVAQLKVTYPKFRNGEAVVRKVTVNQTFGKLMH
jgi:hypothetical protein